MLTKYSLGEKLMKRKNKIVAILAVLLFIAIQYNVVGADINQTYDSFSVEIGDINEDGSQTTNTYEVSEAELVELETILSTLVQSIESARSLEEIENKIKTIPIENTKIGGIVTKIITLIINIITRMKNRFLSILDRSLIISCGKGYKFNPFKHTKLFKLTKRLVFWHYTNGKLIHKTLIFKLKGLKLKILRDRQLGWMRKFFGLYIYIARRFPQRSFTFFFGTARRANGFEI